MHGWMDEFMYVCIEPFDYMREGRKEERKLK
jgi:hypothetical protein